MTAVWNQLGLELGLGLGLGFYCNLESSAFDLDEVGTLGIREHDRHDLHLVNQGGV